MPINSSDGSYSFSVKASFESGNAGNSPSVVSFVATRSTFSTSFETNPAIGIRVIRAHNNSAMPIPFKTDVFLVFFIPNMSFTHTDCMQSIPRLVPLIGLGVQ